MSFSAITVDSVSKRYRLGAIGMTTFRDEIRRWAESRRQRAERAAAESKGAPREFWALRDISFDVPQGQVMGLIGNNGAGKSTMLKILSRITEPSSGEIRIRGRVASLLEVGTGFHPELSGRENIFLNGAMLGMSKLEIRKKFDEIVEFSEIGKFIDTPVKRYSSGMYVRLAFAVAAHLEPEIMIIDEVLAVGDVAFQRKCLGKVSDISRSGERTVLFVSHNMNAVETICTQCTFFKGGQLVDTGNDVQGIVRRYLAEQVKNPEGPLWENSGQQVENPYFRADRFYVTDDTGAILTHPVRNDDPVRVVIEGEILKVDQQMQIGFGLFDSDNDLLFWSTERDAPESAWSEHRPGPCKFVSRLPARLLNEGDYRLDLFVSLYHRKWFSEPGKTTACVYFSIRGGLSDSPCWVDKRPGLLGPVIPWEVRAEREIYA